MASINKEYQLEFQEDDVSWNDAYKEMRENNELTDVTFICDGGEVAAHRVILSAHSPYFQKMFLGNFKEHSTDKIDISYARKDIMLFILDYIYLHQAKIKLGESVDNLIQIYQLSHLFEIGGLCKYYWKLILKNLNTNDWLKIWELVYVHGSDREIYKLLDFILENFLEILGKNFFSITYSQITSLLEKLNENNILIEDDFLEAIIEWSQKTNQPKAHLQTILLQINYCLISTEFMTNLVEKDSDLFEDSFLKEFFLLHYMPKLKTKSELYVPFPLKLFFFRSYRKKKDSYEIPAKPRVEIFDCEMKSFCKIIDNLPFRFGETLITFQRGSEIYIIGGIPNGSSSDDTGAKSFLSYDWKKNQITEKPSLLENVFDPITCISKNYIHALQRCYKTQETTIQYYSFTEKKWFARKYKDLREIACVSVKDTIYLICERSSGYCLLTLKKLECAFHSQTPLPTDNKLNGNSVIVYRDKIFVLVNNSQWHIYDPETGLWDVKKTCIPHNYPVSFRQCYANQVLMFYNEKDHGLYRFHANSINVKKIMDVNGSLMDYMTLDECKWEQVLFFY